MINNNSTVEEVWESFKQGITDSISKNVPSKLSSTRTSLPWINNKFRKMLRRKQRLYRQAKKTNTWSNYRSCQREIKRELRKAECNFINNTIEEGLKSNNMKPFWRYIKSRNQDNIGVSPLKEKGALASDSLQKANILLRQFQSVFTQDRVDEPLPTVKDIHIKYPLEKIAIETDGVTKLLKNLDISKSSGPDTIPNRILKNNSEQLAPGLSSIFQLSLDSGTLPTDWLKANITSIYKKGD